MFNTSDYNFTLPKELIAQEPVANRTDARLMVVDRQSQSIQHAHIRDLLDWIKIEDGLVFNNSKVIPARIVGRRQSTGGRWQGLFLRNDETGCWQLLCKTRGKLKNGERVILQDRDARDSIELSLLTKIDGSVWIARPESDLSTWDLLEQVGRVPLPHYIRGGEMVDDDLQSYQTVFATEPGSIAAPTAGFHFTKSLLSQIESKGIHIEKVTLHVGIGTFRPIACEDLNKHNMHSEWGEITEASAERLNQVRQKGGRIIGVGTTSVRVLESSTRNRTFSQWSGETDLFIRPPYEFQGIDALLTNFHLPRSTLLVLVRTFGGDELIKRAYSEAVEEAYRFFSYGDAMLII